MSVKDNEYEIGLTAGRLAGLGPDGMATTLNIVFVSELQLTNIGRSAPHSGNKPG